MTGHPENRGIISITLQGRVSQAFPLGLILRSVIGPTLRDVVDVALGSQGIGRAIIRVEPDRLLKEPQRRRHAIPAGEIELRQSPQKAVIGVEALRALSLRSLHFSYPEAWLDGPNDVLGDPVLELEYVLHSPLIPVGPDVAACFGLDKLTCDPETLTSLSHTPLQDVAHAEVAPDLLCISGPPFEGEAGTPSDDEEPPNLGERRDDLVGDAVCKILLFRVAAEVCKRQYR